MSSSFAWSRNVFSSWSRNVFSPCFRLLLAPHPLVGAMFASILCVAPADGRERWRACLSPASFFFSLSVSPPEKGPSQRLPLETKRQWGFKTRPPARCFECARHCDELLFGATSDFLLHCCSTLNPMPVESEIWKRCPASVTFTFSPCPLCPPAGERGSLSCACTRDFFRLRLEPSSPPLLWQAQTLAHAARRLRRV